MRDLTYSPYSLFKGLDITSQEDKGSEVEYYMLSRYLSRRKAYLDIVVEN